jgi:hypothetical protein
MTSTCAWLQASSKLYGVTLDGGVSGAIVTSNHFLRQESALYRPDNTTGLFSYIYYQGNVARSVQKEVAVISGPDVVSRTLNQEAAAGT